MPKASPLLPKSNPTTSRISTKPLSKPKSFPLAKPATPSSSLQFSTQSTPLNNTINQYFSRVVKSQASAPSPKPTRTSSLNSQIAWSPSTENAVYTPLKIGEIKSGPGRIRFRGRVVNMTEFNMKMQKTLGASKQRWTLAVADGTGVIEVRLYLRDPQSLRVKPTIGGLVDIHATFVGPLSPKDKQKGTPSTGEVLVSISDTDKESNVEFIEDDEDNYADFRVPLGAKANGELKGVIPLRVFVEGHDQDSDTKILVGIKWKGPRKLITRFDPLKSSFEKREIGIFDDTMECTFSLFGSTGESARNWSIADTMLLIEKPSLSIRQQIVEIRLRRTSVVTVNPLVREATYLRSYAASLIRRNNLAQPFPDELFDVETTLNAEEIWKYTLADMDLFSRDAVENKRILGPCEGILNAVITEMNMASLWKKNMLLCKACCGVIVYSSERSVICQCCDTEHFDLIPNPGIIGRISDETGSVPGQNLLISPSAWEELLGVPVSELWKQKKEYFQDVDAYGLYLRRNFVFGWELEIGKIAIMSIRGT